MQLTCRSQHQSVYGWNSLWAWLSLHLQRIHRTENNLVETILGQPPDLRRPNTHLNLPFVAAFGQLKWITRWYGTSMPEFLPRPNEVLWLDANKQFKHESVAHKNLSLHNLGLWALSDYTFLSWQKGHQQILILIDSGGNTKNKSSCVKILQRFGLWEQLKGTNCACAPHPKLGGLICLKWLDNMGENQIESTIAQDTLA